jgi:hypothetical protein
LANEDLRRDLLRRTNEVPWDNVSQEFISKHPSISLKILENEEVLDKFFDALPGSSRRSVPLKDRLSAGLRAKPPIRNYRT